MVVHIFVRPYAVPAYDRAARGKFGVQRHADRRSVGIGMYAVGTAVVQRQAAVDFKQLSGIAFVLDGQRNIKRICFHPLISASECVAVKIECNIRTGRYLQQLGNHRCSIQFDGDRFIVRCRKFVRSPKGGGKVGIPRFFPSLRLYRNRIGVFKQPLRDCLCAAGPDRAKKGGHKNEKHNEYGKSDPPRFCCDATTAHI